MTFPGISVVSGLIVKGVSVKSIEKDTKQIKSRRNVNRNLILKYSEKKTIFLAGPGRWATTHPSLGVPVEFQDINRVSIICEIAEMHENLSPDASLGTHFFNDIVEFERKVYEEYIKPEEVQK